MFTYRTYSKNARCELFDLNNTVQDTTTAIILLEELVRLRNISAV